MKFDLSSVNWDSIGKTASQVGTAASSISKAAEALKPAKVAENTTTGNDVHPSGGDGGGTPLLLLLALFFLKG